MDIENGLADLALAEVFVGNNQCRLPEANLGSNEKVKI
jgi:hypothetical protein